MNALINEVEEEFKHTKLPTKKPLSSGENSRSHIAYKNTLDKGIQAVVLGKVRDYTQSSLVEGRFNKRYSKLFTLLKRLIKAKDPKFKWNSIQINDSVNTKLHKDKNNIGLSYGISFGNHKGGGLELEGKLYDLKHKFFKYDGTLEHRTIKPQSGRRIAVIFFMRR